jgi:hypothetical protein
MILQSIHISLELAKAALENFPEKALSSFPL